MTKTPFWAGAALISLIVFVGQCHGLWRNGEMRDIEVGREMFLSGNYAVPTLNHEVFLEKPPLPFALVALAFKIGGISENIARVPSALLGALTVIITMLLGRRILGERAGLWAGAILATSALFFERSHSMSIDIVLAAFVGLTLFFFHHLHRQEKTAYSAREVLPMYVFATLAFYTKSFIGVILPGAAIVLFFVLIRDYKGMWRIKPWLGAVVFGVLIAPWFLDLHRQGGTEYLKIVFVDNALFRFVETAESDLGHHTRWCWYFETIWKLFAPWSIVLIPALAVWFDRGFKQRVKAADRMFILAWFLADFAILTASSTKREVYLLPLFPALAILVALAIEHGPPIPARPGVKSPPRPASSFSPGEGSRPWFGSG